MTPSALLFTTNESFFCMLLSHQAVGESVEMPLSYYENNLTGTFILLRLMEEFGCRSIVFSSSATVYGAQDTMPITEESTVVYFARGVQARPEAQARLARRS